ncbi:MAG TPA: hypothetical protein VM942_08860, partial [Acidimicrobiales bacterium]|nr:hypothetical protein [Acidimicrobiales bacterium]
SMTKGESGQVAGLEAICFGLLTFVVGVLLAANAWAVVDAKMAMSAAAREATRAYVEAPAGSDPLALADAAAREAVRGHGRDPDLMQLLPLESGFTRCQVVRFEASYRVPAVTLPFLRGGGAGFTASARHAEVVDPYRDAVPAATVRCDRG